MSNRLLFLPILFLIVLAGVSLWSTRELPVSSGGQKEVVSGNSAQPFSISGKEEGGVTVTAQWGKGAKEMKLFLNTHTFNDLPKFDVKNNVVVKTGGKEILPISWQENPGPSHHRAGTLAFDQTLPDKFQLIVKNLAGVPERILDSSQ